MKKTAALIILIIIMFSGVAAAQQTENGFVLYSEKQAKSAAAYSEAAPIASEAEVLNTPAPIIEVASKTLAASDTQDSLWEGTIQDKGFMGGEDSTDMLGMSFSVFSSLLFVILLAFGISWFIQKRGLIRRNAYGKVITVIPLDTKRMIYITEIIGKYYILGVTENNITKIDEVTNPEMLQIIRMSNSKKPEKQHSFNKVLNNTATSVVLSEAKKKQQTSAANKPAETKDQKRSEAEKKAAAARVTALKELLGQRD